MRVVVSIAVAVAAASLALCASEAGAAPVRRAHARASLGAHRIHRLRTTRVLHHYSAQARANGQAPGMQRIATGASEPGQSDEVGFIKDADHAGYGMKKDNTEAVVGAYRRPPDPNLPATDMFHEGKGAAGVSWSVKLGGH